MDIGRRRLVLVAAASAATLTLMPSITRAWQIVAPEDVGLMPASGLWAVLEHAADAAGSRPAAGEPDGLTAEARGLIDTEIVLRGYLQPLADRLYLLSRERFHCRFCYPFGRGSLIVASIQEPQPAKLDPASPAKVILSGMLTFDPANSGMFYFGLTAARIIG